MLRADLFFLRPPRFFCTPPACLSLPVASPSFPPQMVSWLCSLEATDDLVAKLEALADRHVGYRCLPAHCESVSQPASQSHHVTSAPVLSLPGGRRVQCSVARAARRKQARRDGRKSPSFFFFGAGGNCYIRHCFSGRCAPWPFSCHPFLSFTFIWRLCDRSSLNSGVFVYTRWLLLMCCLLRGCALVWCLGVLGVRLFCSAIRRGGGLRAPPRLADHGGRPELGRVEDRHEGKRLIK